MNVENMREQAELVCYAEKLLPALSGEQQAAFLRVFDMAGWNVQRMKGALAAGYMLLPLSARKGFDNEIAKYAEEVPMMPHEAEMCLRPLVRTPEPELYTTDLEIRAIGRGLGLTVPLPRQSSAHTARI